MTCEPLLIARRLDSGTDHGYNPVEESIIEKSSPGSVRHWQSRSDPANRNHFGDCRGGENPMSRGITIAILAVLLGCLGVMSYVLSPKNPNEPPPQDAKKLTEEQANKQK